MPRCHLTSMSFAAARGSAREAEAERAGDGPGTHGLPAFSRAKGDGDCRGACPTGARARYASVVGVQKIVALLGRQVLSRDHTECDSAGAACRAWRSAGAVRTRASIGPWAASRIIGDKTAVGIEVRGRGAS